MYYLNKMLEYNKENGLIINKYIRKTIQKQIRIHNKYIYRYDRVTQVNKSSAKVALLSSSKGIENKIPVRIESDGSPIYGILSSYDSQQQAYVIKNIDSQGKFKNGDSVFTSGLGTNSGSEGGTPSGLLIGTVIGEKQDSDGLGKMVYVKPETNLYDIRFVFVIKSKIDGQ